MRERPEDLITLRKYMREHMIESYVSKPTSNTPEPTKPDVGSTIAWCRGIVAGATEESKLQTALEAAESLRLEVEAWALEGNNDDA